jgi:hypothetical protein
MGYSTAISTKRLLAERTYEWGEGGEGGKQAKGTVQAEPGTFSGGRWLNSFPAGVTSVIRFFPHYGITYLASRISKPYQHRISE